MSPKRVAVLAVGLIVLCVASLLLISPAWGLNKVLNWGFENATEPGTRWTAGGTATATQNSFTRSTTRAHEGTNSFYGQWTGAASNHTVNRTLTQSYTTPAVPVQAQLSAYYWRTNSGQSDSQTFTVRLLNGAVTVLTAVNDTTTRVTDTAWQSGISAVAQLAANTTYTVQISWVAVLDGTESEGRYVDHVELQVSPSGLGATAPAGGTTASLTWTASTNATDGPNLRGTNPYQVYRGTTSGGETALAFSSTNGYTDSTTTGNTTYYYQVTDFDVGNAESPRSSEVSVLTRPGAPGTPTFSGVTASNVTVSWTAPTGGAANYDVERSPDNNVWTTVGTNVTSPWSDTTVSCNTLYYYKVHGKNATGDGPSSASNSVTTGSCAAAATTVGNGSPAAGSQSVCPPTTGAGTGYFLDAFDLSVTSGSADTINSVTVTATAGTAAGIESIYVTNSAHVQQGSRQTTPSGDTWTISGLSLNAPSATPTQYEVWVVPKTATNMPAPAGATYAIQGRVTAVTHSLGNTVTYNDSNDGTITVDNASPSTSGSWGTVTPGDGQVALNWAIPGDATAVVILRSTTSPITAVPAEGTSYSAGNTIGSSTVVYAGSGTSTTDTPVVNGTDYYYKIFARDGCPNYSATGTQTGPHRPQPSTTTTVGNGTDPEPALRCPSGLAAPMDAFTFVTSAGTDNVSAVTVDFTDGTQAAVRQIEITDDSGGTVYGSTTTITDPVTIALTTNIPVTASPTQYKVRVTPTLHAGLPAPPGSTFAVAGTVTAITCTNTKIYGDSTSSTVTVDNTSPGEAAWVSVTPGSNQLTLSWTNPADGDFAGTVILRQASSISAAPSEGTTYAPPQIIGSAQVVYSGSGSGFADTGVVNGNSYYYKVFARDSCVNYALGAPTGPHQPAAQGVVIGEATAAADSCSQITVSATFTGDPDGDSRTTFERGDGAGGPWSAITGCTALGGGSPRICVDSGLNELSSLYYRVTFTDPDGIGGANPRVIGPYSTPSCTATNTTAGTATAAAAGCRQITVTAPLAGDGDRDGWTTVEYNTTASWPGTTACANLTGVAARSCVIPVLTPATPYYVRVTVADPDGVAGLNPQTIGPVATASCGGNEYPPTILVLSPSRNATIGGVERFKVQVYDPDGVATANVVFGVDGAALSNVGVSQNSSYSCNVGSQTECKVFEFDVATTALANGSHYLTIQVTDSAAPVSVATTSVGFNVLNAGGKARGSGKLLRRTLGAQLCIDCHNLPSHSSQTTSGKYGNWAVDCVTCHGAHGTTNMNLLRPTIETPNSGKKTIVFQDDDPTGGTNKQKAHLGEFDPSGAATKPFDDGLCEACHTRTTHFRNTAAGSDHTHSIGARCSTCHGHSAGFKGKDCNACHAAPSTGGAHEKHREVIVVPTSVDATATAATVTQYGFACAKCHTSTGHPNDTHAGTPADPFRVEVGFDSTADPRNPGATFVQAYPGALETGPDGRSWSWTSSTAGTDGSCSNLYCHSNATPLGGAAVYQDVKWSQSPLTCSGCHGTAGAASTLSAAHRVHTDSGKYGLVCVRCHANTASAANNASIGDKRNHVDGARDVDFDASGPDNSGGNYDYGAHTCANTYCHSNGQDNAAPYSSGASVPWTAGVTCRSCHAGDATQAPTMASGKHPNHVDNAVLIGSNYLCATCHDATVDAASNSAVTGFAAHVNGAPTVQMSTGTWNDPSCSSSYCHSSGQANPEYYIVNWNTASLDCKGCHGRATSPAFSSQFGEPNHVSGGAGQPAANTHAKHVGAASDCGDCHTTTSTTGAAIISGSTEHTDGTRDVAILLAWDGNGGTRTDNYTPGTKTCASVSCHPSQSPQWGGMPFGCRDCHLSAGAGNQDVADYTFKNGTFAKIDGEDWAAYGHGTTATFAESGNPKADFDLGGRNGCAYCHDATVDHNDSGNPFRLANSGGADGKNGACLTCHKSAGDAGHNPGGIGLVNGTRKVGTSHYGSRHGVGLASEGGAFCWDCHDPHGDYNYGATQRIGYMVQERPTQDHSGSAGWGIPTTLAPAVDFRKDLDGNGGTWFWGDFNSSVVVSGTYRGVCQVCHTQNSKFNQATYNAGVEGVHFPAEGSCTTAGCHLHNNNFKNKGCNECHEAAPRPGAPSDLDSHLIHYEVATVPQTFDNLASAATATQYGFACKKCHATTHLSDIAHTGALGDGFDVGVAFDGTADPKNPSGTFTQEPWSSRADDQSTVAPADGRYWRWTDDTSGSFGSCGNLYCHSNATPLGGTNLFVNVRWNRNDLTCTGCHSDTGSGGTTLSAKHGKHVNGGSANAYTCDECHATVVTDDAKTSISDKRLHVDGAKAVAFSATSFATDAVNQSAGTYSGSTAYTCSNTYCHSQGQSTTAPFGGAPFAPVANWNWSTGTVGCESCHGGNAAATDKIISGAHDTHTNQSSVVGTNFGCVRCHEGIVSSDTVVSSTSLHVNAARNVNASDDTTTVWNGTTCSSSYCHSDGTETPGYPTVPNWASGTLANDCKGCHGTEGGSLAGEPRYANNTGSMDTRNSHATAGHVVAATDCVKCHDSTVTAAGALEVSGTQHLDVTRDVDNATFISTYDEATETCSTVCHGGNSVQWGATLGCRSCHVKTGAGDQDVDDYTNDNLFGDGVGTTSIVDSEDWYAYGHGRTTAFPQTNRPASNFDNGNPGTRDGCLYCHSAGVGHFDAGGNFFRLANTGVADGKNGNCLTCHKTGSAGYNPGGGLVNGTVKINANHYGADHSATGDGGAFCWDCHDPHGDYNYGSTQQLAFMVQEQPVQDHSGATGWGIPTTLAPAPDFRFNRDGTGAAGTFSWGDYASDTLASSTYRGICQVCHTSANVDYFRQTLYTAGHNNTESCTLSCHKHDQAPSDAFKPAGGGGCLTCHGASAKGPRRAVTADFANGTTPNFRSHHVGNSTTTTLRGTLTDLDCVVCHAEGTSTGGVTATTAYHNDGNCDGDTLNRHCIDLKNADNTATVYSYDKRAICRAAGGTSTNCDTAGFVGTVANWSSATALWQTEMRDKMDPFCLSCHDVNGASASYTLGEATATAQNPFFDASFGLAGGSGHITNNYDQVGRGTSIVNIRNRVDSYVDASNNAITPIDRDLAGQPRGPDTRADPVQGIYSRHAIRGRSVSVYGTTNANMDNNTYWTNSTLWNSTSVMGCADCHTSDGANGSAGNAHGSGSEYLLKDASGGAAEGNNYSSASGNYVCFKCHNRLKIGSGVGHTGNSGDFQDYTGQVGTARWPVSTSGGSIFGYACANCHSGLYTSLADATPEYGTIHGTSQIMNNGVDGSGLDSKGVPLTPAGATRQAYRFANGNSMRFYDPKDWAAAAATCYTLSAGDGFAGCTKHDTGTGHTRQFTRPIKY